MLPLNGKPEFKNLDNVFFPILNILLHSTVEKVPINFNSSSETL